MKLGVLFIDLASQTVRSSPRLLTESRGYLAKLDATAKKYEEKRAAADIA